MFKNEDDLVNSFVEIRFNEPDDFLKIRETLSRIGVCNKDRTELYQSVYILKKRNRYFLVHFKELFLLDGKHATITEDDYARRNTIASMIHAWGLCQIINTNHKSPVIVPKGNITVVPFKDKSKWNFVPKYTIGHNTTQATNNGS